MFKIESYITPLLMGYLDKYVKLRPEDFQLSLWGGDAVLYNLDLRLDIIEKAMQLPIVFQSGHIHELRLHVPWTKLGSDPVVVTINTIECILKLRDTAYTDRGSSRAGSETPVKSVQKRKTSKQNTDHLPPGYLQSLMNKIANNANIIVNNLIVKFVEDDVVLSLNVKSAECYSVDKDWNRAFVEISAPDFILRRAINFCDLTCCLDKRDASGKIEHYQDPLVYRCSVNSRMYTKYENLHGKYPLETKMNVYCERLDLSLTDIQLPMLIRLIELCMALYYRTLEFKNVVERDDKSEKSQEQDSGAGSSVGEPPPDEVTNQQQGWASWAWSYVPQLLPEEEEEDYDPAFRKKRKPPIFTLGMYAYKLTLKFKLTELIKEKAHYGPKKIQFTPFLYLESEGIAVEMLMQGILFFDSQFGITNLTIYTQGPCICGAEGEENSRNNIVLSGGDSLSNKTTNNYISQSLFDLQSPENLGIPISKILDFDEHKQVYTEQYGTQKYGVFWMDYLYSMNKPDDNLSSQSSVSSVEDSSVFVVENSLSRFLIGQCHLNVSSSTVHRIQKFIDAAYRYEYEPYSKKHKEKVDENRPHPTEDQVQSLERFIPTRTYHLTFLQPIVSVLSAEHAYCDVAKKTYRSQPTGRKSKSSQGSTLFPLFAIQLSSQRFDLQVTSAMYPRRLVQLVSKMAGPSSQLLHHCHSHTQIKLFGLHVGLTRVDTVGSRLPLLTLLTPTSGAMYTTRLLLPMYWNNSYLPKLEKVYELPQITLKLSKCSLLVVMAILSSWKQKTPKPSDIQNTSLLEDAFPTQEPGQDMKHQPVLEMTISGSEMRTCRNDLVTACSGTVSSIAVYIHKHNGTVYLATPILSNSSHTDTLHTSDWLTQQNSPVLEDMKNDCLTFTYQLPRKPEHVQAPAVVLLNLEGMTCLLDPVIKDWFGYTPVSKVVVSDKANIELDIDLAKAASPLQGNVSQVSVASSGSKRQTVSLSRSPTTGQQSTLATQTEDKEGSDRDKQSGIGGKLAKIFPIIRVTQVQIEMKKSCVFLPRCHIDIPIGSSVNIVRDLHNLARSRSLPEVMVICLPQVIVQSAGIKTVSYIQEIPITSVDGSLVGDKIPWNVSLRQGSVYTVHSTPSVSVQALPLVHPATVGVTVGVSYKYNPPTSDTISALGLCLHTDMHAIKLATCLKQITFITELASHISKLVDEITSLITVVTKALAQDKSKPEVSTLSPPLQTIKPSRQQTTNTLSATSITEEDIPYTTTSGDVTSLDTTPSREMEILDNGSEGVVKLSLWLQWTLPKCELNLYFTGKEEVKLRLLLEDLTMSVDVQDVYSKLKVNVGSANLNHFIKPRTKQDWQTGPQEGILMSCRDNLSHDTNIVSSRLWSADTKRTTTAPSGSTFQTSQQGRELTHGLLSLTFTRALSKNLKKRLQKMNVENPVMYDQGNTISNQYHFHKYVSEICINMNPCDFVVCTAPLLTAIHELATLNNSKAKKSTNTKTAKMMSAQKGDESDIPMFTSSNLPLIYADIACIRIFLPGEATNGAQTSAKGNNPSTTMDHDMYMLQLQSISIAPHADNPLPRYALDKGLYQHAVQLGVTQQSGAAMADRQYQLDMKHFSVSTGCWSEFIKPCRGPMKPPMSPVTQIPAVEWNSPNTFKDEHKDIQLFPLIPSCDMRLVTVPAIVNSSPVYGSNKLQKTLICGYGLEFNIISDLDLHCSINQIHLLQKITSAMLQQFREASTGHDDSADDRDSMLDSGIGSDISMATANQKPPNLKSDQSKSKSDRKWVCPTPCDILLTAGRISLVVYSHNIAEKDIKLEKEKMMRNKFNRKHSTQSLDWRVNMSEDSEGENYAPEVKGQGQGNDSFFTQMFEAQSSPREVKFIPEGSTCIQPFLFVYLTQPHTVLSCHMKEQKFEMSCYDVLIKGPPEISTIQVSEVKLLPDCSDFTDYWLETRAGQVDHTTGVPPSLYTLTVTDFLQHPADIRLKMERPIKLNVSFIKVQQVQDFLQCLLPWEPRQTPPTNTSRPSADNKSAANSFSTAILRHMCHVEVVSEQVVVAMETKSCGELPGVVTSFTNLMMEANIQHSNNDIERCTMTTYVRDLYLKTVYCDRQLPLFGPSSVKFDTTFTNICHNDVHFLSQTVVTMATGLVTINVGQEHVLCLSMIGKHLIELIEKLSSGASSSRSKSWTTSKQKVSKPDKLLTDYIVHKSSDDLKCGGFQYIMEQDYRQPVNPGEIVFCNKDRMGNSSMTWSYSHPRVISSLSAAPIPFNVSGIRVQDSIKVECTLQYWECLIQQFVDYIDMELWEEEMTEACLPDIHTPHTSDLIVAQTWRIVIRNNQSDDTAMIYPASLAASMKVDSCFIPSLVPTVQVGCTVESMEVHLSNHIHCLGKVNPSKLKPFVMSSCYPATGEFAVLTIDNILLAGSQLTSHQHKIQTQFTATVMLDVLEYKTLTMQRVISPFELSGIAGLQEYSKVNIDVTCEPLTVQLGQGVIHNLTSSVNAWNQLLTDPQSADEVIFGHYVICNDTQQSIRFGQAGTDENLVLTSREMHQYGWRSHKTRQELHICLDGRVWKWCEPIDINMTGTLVRSVTSQEQQYTLIITVLKLSNVQNQIIVSGQLTVCNRLSHHLEMKVITKELEQDHKHCAVIGSEHIIPSYIIQSQDIVGVKFRPLGNKGVWSKEVFIGGVNCKDTNLVKISVADKFSFHFWCRIFIQKIKSVDQIFVVLCPLYTLRSHLPQPLYVNIDTSKLNLHQQIEAPGRGQDLQLTCGGGDLHQSLTFQFSPVSGKSTAGVTLSCGLIDQLERASVPQFDARTLRNYWKQRCNYAWPYGQTVKIDEDTQRPDPQNITIPDIEGIVQSTIDLNISLSELWPGCPTVLVNITPPYLVNNMCQSDLVVMGTEDVTFNLPKGQSICPTKFEGSFHIGVCMDGESYMSAAIPVSEDEVGAQRYRQDVGRTLYLDSHVHVPVYADSDGQKQVYFLTITSLIKHDMRVITVRERYCFTNLTSYNLTVCPFTLPTGSNKVEIPKGTTQIIPSHQGCNKNTSDLHCLTFHPLVNQSEASKHRNIDQSQDFVHYLAFKNKIQSVKQTNNCVNESETSLANQNSSCTESESNSSSDWSFPIRLLSNENGRKITTSVTLETDGCGQCVALAVIGQEKKGVTYFTIQKDQAPSCFIKNKCQFTLYYGQTLMNLSLSGTTIQEQTELVSELPTLQPGDACYYTPPHVNTTFPQINEKTSIPKIHIAGRLLNISKKADVTDTSNLKWSQPIDLQLAADNFVAIPELADVKVHVQQISMVTFVTVESITKADVSAKEIRSRLKGKERTIVLESKEIEMLEERGADELKLSAKVGEYENRNNSADKNFSSKKKKAFEITFGILLQQVAMVIQDELSSATSRGELVRFTADDIFVASYPASEVVEQLGYHRNCFVLSIGDMQLDNQDQKRGNYDFPVVMLKQKTKDGGSGSDHIQLSQMNIFEKHAVLKSRSVVHVQVVVGNMQHRNHVIESVEVTTKPLSFYIDDTFIFRCMKEVEGFLPVILSYQEPLPVSVLKLPSAVKCTSRSLSSPILIGHLCVQPFAVMLSIHASLKVFIASDHTPLSFGKFERHHLSTTSYQLTRVLAMHYASGALFRAGAVLGSLEILGNPTGLVRNIGTGVADFFRMPYRGLTKGPGAFVRGVSHGTSSMVKNVTTGMLTSITNFASSISRNMDRLSLDTSHVERQEESRRHRPDGVGDGLKQGLTGLGISLLGAVAGLADQPIQSMVQSDDNVAQSKSSAASSIVTGMGKGIVGALTKPIGGAAEFVSQTGQGILQGTGLSVFPEPRCPAVLTDLENATCGQLKYALKLLESLPSNDIVCCTEAMYTDLTDTPVPVTLILTPEILFVVNHEEDSQQQSFSVSEVECGVTMGDNPVLSIIWNDTRVTQHESQFGPSAAERVTAFIDGATMFMQQTTLPEMVSPDSRNSPLFVNNNTTGHEHLSTQNQCNQNLTHPLVADTAAKEGTLLQMTQTMQGRQFTTVIEGEQLSDTESESSSSVIGNRETTFPQYDFNLSPTKLAAFLAVFNITKHKLNGTGFAV